jgi:N-acetyl-gamma-glutamyl-phosphate reductase
MIKVGIVGGTGYTGVELLRLLAHHPEVSLQVITSRSEAGMAVSELFPNLRGHVDLVFSEPNVEQLAACDLVFFATPHTVAMALVPDLIARGTRVIDLSADFRLKDAVEWEQWYSTPHTCPELLKQAVYGLPELNREQIKSAQLVAAPGCYPTATQLGFLPLLESGAIDPSLLIADAKSGVSGAGRKASVGALLAESSENMKAYAVAGHRHLPEIKQGLNIVSKQPVNLTFVPHLTPMIRGIHATLYGQLTADIDLQSLFEQRYANEPFVDVLPAGSHPETRSVRGANVCRIAVHQPQGGNTVVVLSVIDNLVKGASGQAIQNMNIMFGFEETLAINTIATLP